MKDELVDWIPASVVVVAGAWLLLTMPFPAPLVATVAVDDEAFAAAFTVCSKVSSCERSKVRNLS